MKKLDRILNIILGIAVVIFIANHFLKPDAPDAKKDDFAPVTLSAASDAKAEAPAAKAPVSVDMPPPFSPLTWDQLDARFAATKEKPLLVVIYASWCPYCKKLMPHLVDMAEQDKDRLDIIGISIDKEPQALKDYLNTLPKKPNFPTYINGSDNDMPILQGFLFRQHLQFNGGVPFMAYIDQGKAYTQFSGYVEKNVLTSVLDRIERERNTKNNGS